MQNNEEKSLTVVETGNYNFLIKLKNFFSKVFSNTNDTQIDLTLTDTKTSSFEDTYGDKTIEQIQSLYEFGKIKESELPDYKLQELKELYVSQIIQMDEDSIRFN